MTMKVKNFMMLLALAGLAAGCSNDDLTEGGGSGTPTGARSEIQLSFSGTGESQDYERSARAIASESENRIDKLSVYLFASNAQNGTYYYLETWEEGTAYDVTTNPTGFKKQASGTGWKASIYPHELKGLPYIKLLCVANNTTTGATTDGKFYQEDGATGLPALTAVTTNADGTVTNPAAATTDAAFKTACSKALGKTEADGVIATPLLMTGEGQTKISGSVSVVNIDLKRIMARFDIDNTSSRSSLTIKQVTMAHGRVTGALFGATPTKVEQADLETDAKLMNYQAIDFTKHTGANQGLAESALYVYPTLATDESYLIVEGTYKSPVTSVQVPVTYNIPIVRTAEGQPKGEYIPIKANSRYKLRISDVTQSNIFGTFEVEDWTSGGGINVKPDNDSPVFDDATAFGGTDNPKALTDADGAVYGYEVTSQTNDGKGSFDITIAATGKVRAEKGEVARAAGDTDWLTVGLAATDPYKEKDGVWYTTFSVSYANAIGQQPVAVTFINDAASYDPALWTVVNFYGPKAHPSFAVVSAGGVSTGNKSDATDEHAPTASIYSVNGSYVMFDVTCTEGVTTDLTSATGYTVTPVEIPGNDNKSLFRYKIAVNDAANANGGTIAFKNKGDESKVSTLTVTSLDPAMTLDVQADPTNGVKYADSPAPTVTVDIDVLTAGGYTFKVNAPEGVSLSAAELAKAKWVTITEETAWNDTDKFAVYKVTPKSGNPDNTDDFTLKFTNALTDADAGITAEDVELTFHKDFGKPTLSAGTTTASWSAFNQSLTSDFTNASAATIEMYMVANSAVTVNLTCAEAAAFDNDPAASGVTISQVSGDEYKIEVTDVTKLKTDAPTTLTAYNTGAKDADAGTDRKATLAITWKSAAITAELTDDNDGAVVKTTSGDDLVFTMDASALTAAGFKISVTAAGGATTDLSVFGGDTDFLMKHTSSSSAETLVVGGTEVYQFKRNDESQTGDITMTLTNAIEGGKDLKLIFKNTYTAP